MSPRSSPLGWAEALVRYQAHLQARRASARTVEQYSADLRLLARWVDETPPGQVTLEQLRDFQCGLFSGQAAWKGKAIGAGSVNRITAALTGFFRFLAEEELIAQDPSARLERPRVTRRPPGQVLTRPEVQRLLAAADTATPRGLRNRALVEVLYATGLRRAEVIALDLGDLDASQRDLTVRHGKGDKSRVVPLTRSAFAQVEAYLTQARPYLVSEHPDGVHALFLTKRGQRVHTGTLRRVLQGLAAEAGIKKRVTPHTLRRTFATHLLKGKVTLRHIQTLLGHAQLSTTAAYLRLDADEIRREILLHHPRERFE